MSNFDMSVLITQLIQLFLVMAIGYIAFKMKIFTHTVCRHLSTFVLEITMPIMIIDAVLSLDNSQKPGSSTIITLFIASILFYIVMPIIAFFVVKILAKTINIKKYREGLYMLMMVFGNVGFMGFPILKAACGSNGELAVFYAAILNIFFNIAFFTYGIMIVGYGTEIQGKISWKKFISPGMISSFVGIALYAFGIHYPASGKGNMFTDILEGLFGTIGDLTPPLAMILVGATLASVAVREVFNEWRIYVFVFVRQIILPLLLFPIFRIFIKDSLLSTVLFIEFLMPIANSAVIIANEYDLDSRFASKAIFISTLASIVAIPLMLYLTSLMPI